MNNTELFLKKFPGNLWLQAFPDDKTLKTEKTELTRCFRFYSDSVHQELKSLNSRGAGIYFCVNELSLGADCRSNAKISNIRAFFLDLDGAPLMPVLSSAALPDIVVRTSKERFHCYWLLDEKAPADRETFRNIQKNIAIRFNGDKSINDLCRVMRLPGYNNMKGLPFRVRWLMLSDDIKEEIKKGKIDAYGLLEMNWL